MNKATWTHVFLPWILEVLDLYPISQTRCSVANYKNEAKPCKPAYEQGGLLMSTVNASSGTL